MFDNAMIALMVMLLLCFLGMLVMFLFVIRGQSAVMGLLRKQLAQQESFVTDTERQLMGLRAEVRNFSGISASSLVEAEPPLPVTRVKTDLSALLHTFESGTKGDDLAIAVEPDDEKQKTGSLEDTLPDLDLSGGSDNVKDALKKNKDFLDLDLEIKK